MVSAWVLTPASLPKIPQCDDFFYPLGTEKLNKAPQGDKKA